MTKQEQIRQQSVMKELQMREAERKNRVKEEAEIKAKVERENRDIYLEQIRLRAQEGRVTTLESIKYYYIMHILFYKMTTETH